jgi:hypothetical protein
MSRTWNGLPLESIRACLDVRVDPQLVVRDQLAQLDATTQALARLRERVAQILDAGLGNRHLDDPGELRWA